MFICCEGNEVWCIQCPEASPFRNLWQAFLPLSWLHCTVTPHTPEPLHATEQLLFVLLITILRGSSWSVLGGGAVEPCDPFWAPFGMYSVEREAVMHWHSLKQIGSNNRI